MLTKSNNALPQLTSTGDTVEVDLSDAYAAVISLRHANGAGSITAGATVQPQLSHDGVNWRNDGGAFAFSNSAGAIEHRTYVPPTDGLAVKAVRFAYTAPSGGSGHSLDIDLTKTTEV